MTNISRAQAQQAVHEAAGALDTRGQTVEIRIAADPSTMHYLQGPRVSCPAPLPCLGLTGIRIAVPVRVVAAGPGSTHDVGEKIGEVLATHCPACRLTVSDASRNATAA